MSLNCWYDNNEMVLTGNKWAKVKAYNRNRLINALGCNLFELLPLKGNKQSHHVFYDGLNNSCTCQNFRLKHDEFCSHIMAVKYKKDIIDKEDIRK